MKSVVAVLFGGPSNEHEISCRSGRTIMQALVDAGHQIRPIAVEPDGTFRYIPNALEVLNQMTSALPRTSDIPGGEVITTIDADVVFPALHGYWGEDGQVQKLLDQMNLKYVGSDALASKICMDKSLTKQALNKAGIQNTRFISVSAKSWQNFKPELLAEISKLGEILFVKPQSGGSSVGISKVSQSSQIDPAITLALQHDEFVIIEEAVMNPREIEIAILENPDGSLVVSVCGEVKVKPEFDFYDYNAKYIDDGAELIVPADIGNMKYQDIAINAKKAFMALGCAGLARVDFLMGQDGTVYLNEINTMPGFTSISMYPKMMAATNIELVSLVDRLVQHALWGVNH
jgi:D-alanine-D-alanine ligase